MNDYYITYTIGNQPRTVQIAARDLKSAIKQVEDIEFKSAPDTVKKEIVSVRLKGAIGMEDNPALTGEN